MKQRKSQRIASFAAACFLTLGLLAGCGDASSISSASAAPSPGSNTAAEQPEEITLRICWWGNQTRNDYTMAALDLYTEQNPHVTFEVEFSEWDGYWDKLATQAASGNMADVVQMAITYIKQYAEKDQIAPLNQYIDSGALDTADIADASLESGIIGGELYGVVAGMSSKALLVRSDIMADCGVTLPDQPTYEELFEAAKTIYEQTGMQIEIPSNDEQTMLFIARSYGQTIFNAEGDALGMEDESIALEYYQMLLDTLDMGIHVSPETMAEASTQQQGLFASEKTWCVFINLNQIPSTLAQCKDDIAYEVLMFPTTSGATQQPVFLTPSMFWSVAQTSQHQEEAAKVIDFLTNNVEANMLLQGERGIPINATVSEALKSQYDEATIAVADYIEWVTPVVTPIDPPAPPAQAEVATLISDLADKVRFREINPEEAASEFFAKANQILQEKAE